MNEQVEAIRYHKLYKNAERGAKKRGIPFGLTEDGFMRLVKVARGCCMLTGIPFDYDFTVGRRHPYAPSLDRIDSSRGYFPDNVRLVCCAVNIALAEWGDGVLARIAHGLLKPRDQKPNGRLTTKEYCERRKLDLSGREKTRLANQCRVLAEQRYIDIEYKEGGMQPMFPVGILDEAWGNLCSKTPDTLRKAITSDGLLFAGSI